MKKFTVFEIERDGLKPAHDAKPGTLAFISDGCIASGWPCQDEENQNEDADLWEGNSDVSFGKFSGVKKYVIFNMPLWKI